jgi:hypothetical protein
MLLATGVVGAAAETATDEVTASPQLDRIVAEKRQFYRRTFPKLTFAVLRGGEDWYSDFAALSLLLGPEPASLDYEHPARLRSELMDVSLQRILIMLQHRAPSASLFRTDPPPGFPEDLCVITLDPGTVAGDSARATRHLLDQHGEGLGEIPEGLHLEEDDYLELVFDHEAYHCLQSFFGGGQPMSDRELWAEYSHFRDENAADAFAIAMHLARHGEVTGFAENYHRIRGMALFNLDPDHWTCPGIAAAIEQGPVAFAGMSVEQRVKWAMDLRARVAPSYDAYLRYLGAALHAIDALGRGADIDPRYRQLLADQPVDQELAGRLTDEARRCYRELAGAQPPAALPPTGGELLLPMD